MDRKVTDINTGYRTHECWFETQIHKRQQDFHFDFQRLPQLRAHWWLMPLLVISPLWQRSYTNTNGPKRAMYAALVSKCFPNIFLKLLLNAVNNTREKVSIHFHVHVSTCNKHWQGSENWWRLCILMLKVT